MHWCPTLCAGGIFVGYIGSDIDITDLQSEERFRQMAANIDEVFWMFDLATRRVLYVSPAFEKVWGCRSTPLYKHAGWLLETIYSEDRTLRLACQKRNPRRLRSSIESSAPTAQYAGSTAARFPFSMQKASLIESPESRRT